MAPDDNDDNKKRDSSWVKSWWERDFDTQSFKFRSALNRSLTINIKP